MLDTRRFTVEERTDRYLRRVTGHDGWDGTMVQAFTRVRVAMHDVTRILVRQAVLPFLVRLSKIWRREPHDA